MTFLIAGGECNTDPFYNTHRRACRSPSGAEQLVAFFTLGRVGALSYGHIAFLDRNKVVNALKLSQSSILESGENPGSLHVVNGVSTNMLSALSGSRKLHGYVVPLWMVFWEKEFLGWRQLTVSP